MRLLLDALARTSLLGVLAFTLSACDSGRCGAGEHCECAGGNSCYLDCEGDGCVQSCHDMASCGAVCGDNCDFACFSTTECSDYCGAGCSMDCRGMDRCGTICGAGCNYSCRSTNICGARVGSGSTVLCEDVSSCVVECEGDCRVTCTRVGSNGCRVSCLGGGAPTSCGADQIACGPC